MYARNGVPHCLSDAFVTVFSGEQHVDGRMQVQGVYVDLGRAHRCKLISGVTPLHCKLISRRTLSDISQFGALDLTHPPNQLA